MTEKERIQRDMNPHKEAKFAMWMWSKEYARKGLGSMTFYDQLDDYRKMLCKDAIDEIEAISWRENFR